MVLGFFPGVKQLRYEDDQSSPPSSEVKDLLYLHSAYTPSLHEEGQFYLFIKEANISTSFSHSLKQGWTPEDTGNADTVSK